MNDDTYWNSEGQLISREYDDIYFSSENGIQETQYVFLDQNQLKERFESLPENGQFTIGETGFGTGLNFLATCLLWEQYAPKTASLFFISVEKFPLPIEVIQRVLSPWNIIDQWKQELLQNYPATLSGTHHIHFSKNISLTLIINDAQSGLQSLIANPFLSENYKQDARQWHGIDAWFLDGFAPSKNPDMWTEELFKTIAALSHSQTTLATFTAAGIVKRGLKTVGFSVNKISGYGRKREMIIARYFSSEEKEKKVSDFISNKSGISPWTLKQNYQPTPKTNSIAILGGGLAGCHTAKKLAEAGYRVTLYERGTIASGASGNAQGIVYAKLSSSMEPQGAFNLFSLMYAQRYYRDYWQTHSPKQGDQCGVLQLSFDEKTVTTHKKVAHFFKDHPQLVRYISATEASKLANTSIDFPALYFQQSGWLAPQQVCRWLLQNDNITIKENVGIQSLQQSDQGWQLQTSLNTHEYVDCVVICNAYDANELLPENTLPIKKIRGQVTHYPQSSALNNDLQLAVCGQGYIAPSDDIHCIGASFNLGETSTELNINDHQSNIEKIASQVPDIIDQLAWPSEALEALSGRVSFRCTTPDYLPIVGQLPIFSDMQERFARLQYDASKIPNRCGRYYPNLFMNIGHGSRGLCYTPLCSEIISSQISGAPPPLAQTLLQKLNPARFLIRDLIRST